MKTWLSIGYLPEILKQGVKRTVAEDAGRQGEATWEGTILSLCILCEDWKCPLVFNEATDHFALLFEIQPIDRQLVLISYERTKVRSGLRHLVVNLILGRRGGLGHLEFLYVGKAQPAFLADMWNKWTPPRSLLFDGSNAVSHDRLMDYHMSV